jgi:hypothetical protein
MEYLIVFATAAMVVFLHCHRSAVSPACLKVGRRKLRKTGSVAHYDELVSFC